MLEFAQQIPELSAYAAACIRLREAISLAPDHASVPTAPDYPGNSEDTADRVRVLAAAVTVMAPTQRLRSIYSALSTLSIMNIDELKAALASFAPAVEPAPGQSLSDAYLDQIAAQIDSSTFPQLLDTIAADKRLKREDIVAIASKVAYPMAKGTSKVAAIKALAKLHAASEAFASKSLANRGKSAA